MDFKTLQEKAKQITQAWVDISKKSIKKAQEHSQKVFSSTDDFLQKKLSNSAIILKTSRELDDCIDTSKNTSYTDEKTKIKKEFIKKSFVIFLEKDTAFSKNILYKIPILSAKVYSQNMQFGIVLWENKWMKIKKYSDAKLPSLILFENTQVKKVISWEENIQKVVNALSLDINKTINEL